MGSGCYARKASPRHSHGRPPAWPPGWPAQRAFGPEGRRIGAGRFARFVLAARELEPEAGPARGTVFEQRNLICTSASIKVAPEHVLLCDVLVA